MGTAGHFVDLSNTVTGVNDLRTGWTVNPPGATASGNVYEHGVSVPVGNLAAGATSWFGAWILGAGASGYYKLPFWSAAPLDPPPGYCGIGANNTIRVNLNGQNPNTLSSMYPIYARAESVDFFNCVGAYTVDGVTQVEGDGVYFDNGSYRCFSHDCAGLYNQGNGAFLNDPTECGHYRFFAYNNLKGGVCVARGDGTNIHGGTFICLPNTNGIRYTTGNQRAKARMNTVIGAAIGAWSNDLSTNDVTEDENLYVNCATRLSNVASGARSANKSVSSTSFSNYGLNFRRAIAAAELVI
jgi:hypothetical protein